MRVTEIATGRLKYTLMEPRETYIVDQGGLGLFVRVGSHVSKEQKLQNLKVAVNYLRSKKYPDFTQVTMVTQGSEIPLFKQMFVDWPQKGFNFNQKTYHAGRGIGENVFR
jgi:hypothetical protein